MSARAALVACLLSILAGCHAVTPETAAKPKKQTPADVVRTEIDRGLIKVTVEVRPHPVRLSDEPTLTLTIDSQRGVEIEKPPFGDAIGGFIIRDYREPLLESKGDREIRRQVYTLEPAQTGTLHIAPIPVTFTDRRPKGDGQRHTVETESLAITVTSVVGSEAPSLSALKPASGPIALPEPSTSPLVWLVGIVLVASGSAVGVWWRLRRRRQREEKPLSPQELAYLELDALLQEHLSESDVKLFYVRLTGIVRRFIERTTGIHAPEQTTEEFLYEIGRGQVFSGAERDRLKWFLESADLVKFAAQEPIAGDIETTFQRAKAFLGLLPQEVAA